MGDHRWHEVHNNNDAFSKIKFKIPPFDGKYDEYWPDLPRGNR
jgi:hypothetical protein